MAKYTVGDLTDMIKRNARMDLALLGSNVTEQNNYIFNYLTLALWKYAGLVFYVRTSDPIEVTTNGPVTFQIDGADVEDMYSQQYILNANGQKVTKRSAFDDKSNGWFREGFNQQLDIRGAGTYTLVYRAYHPKITATNQELLWPQTSYNLLMYETIGKIKPAQNPRLGSVCGILHSRQRNPDPSQIYGRRVRQYRRAGAVASGSIEIPEIGGC